MAITEAILLAAGQGTRLRVVSGDRPKPLVEVAGKTLLARNVEAFLAAGIERVIVVVGYEHGQVRAHVAAQPWSKQVTIVQNDDWKRENGISVFAARDAVRGERCLLQMVDHLVEADVYRRVLAAPLLDGVTYLCTDRAVGDCFDIDDATKVVAGPDGEIAAIGKALPGYNAIDTGLFVLDRSIFDFFAAAIAGGRCTISHAMGDAGLAGRFRALDVTGAAWLDVDTEDAWREAERRAAAPAGNGA